MPLNPFPNLRPIPTNYVIAPPPVRVVDSAGQTAAVAAPTPAPVQWDTVTPPAMVAPVYAPAPAPASSGPSEAQRIMHILKEHEGYFGVIEKMLKEMSAAHASFAEAIKTLRTDLNEVSRTANQADQNVLTLAANIEANLGTLDQQIRNQGEAITALTRGVVETFAPRQVTVPGASRRRAKISTKKTASASQAVVDVTPGNVSPGEPVSEKAMAMFHGLIVDDN